MRRRRLHRLTVDIDHAPQTLPVLHPELEVLPNEYDPLELSLEANEEICLVTFWLSQIGQVISVILLELRISASND